MIQVNKDFFFFWLQYPFFCEQQRKDRRCWTNRGPTYTQLSRPRTLKRGGNKEKTDENDLFLTKTTANLSSSSPGSGMGSFRGMLCPLKSVCWSMLPAFPMFPSLTKNFPPCPLEKRKKKKKTNRKISARRKKRKISARPLVCSVALSGSLQVYPGPGHFFKIKHMWERQQKATGPSSRSSGGSGGGGSGSGGDRAPGEAFPRQKAETWKLDSIHTDLSALLSVSCTISAPLPVGSNDDEHDSRLLQAPVC